MTFSGCDMMVDAVAVVGTGKVQEVSTGELAFIVTRFKRIFTESNRNHSKPSLHLT